jgi:hypothetical protein
MAWIADAQQEIHDKKRPPLAAAAVLGRAGR